MDIRPNCRAFDGESAGHFTTGTVTNRALSKHI